MSGQVVAGGPLHVVVMGPAGTGKSAVADAIGRELDVEVIEGDRYHPDGNIARMSAGIPLTDEDRLPWLRILADMTAERHARGVSTVLACSALRRTYRDVLRGGVPDGETFFIELHADLEVLLERMQNRAHFMPPSLLRSQFDTLEPLEPDEVGVVIDVAEPLDVVVSRALAAVRARYHDGECGDWRE